MEDLKPYIPHLEFESDKFNCPVCMDVMIEPCQTQCGHRFCSKCINVIMESPNNVCPFDRLNISNWFIDRCCEREIGDLICSCIYEECDWKGEFRQAKDHIDNHCDYVKFPCDLCKELFVKKDLPNHAKHECPMRVVWCKHCTTKLLFTKTAEHMGICQKYPLECLQKCGETVIRGEMERHIEEECSKSPQKCPYFHLGCLFKGHQDELARHLEKDMGEHIRILSATLCRQAEQIEMLNKKLETASTEARVDVGTCKVNEALTDRLKNQAREFRFELNDVKKDVRYLRDNVDRSEMKERNIEDRVHRLEEQDTVHTAELSEQDHLIQKLEATSYSGDYIWKIDHWSRRVREARNGTVRSIYSPPFYIGRFGYKVCGRLYPDGDGIGKGTHVSLFFVVMRGEYDSLLPWPFHQKVSFRMIDQNRVKDQKDAFRPCPGSSSFKQPMSEMNIASGCPQFITNTELESGGFIKHDTMYIQISVDTSRLGSFINIFG